jgi:hypothetical protein
VTAALVDVLERQHARIAALFDQVSRPDADRPVVLRSLLRELAAHVAAERAEVYPAVKARRLGPEHLADRLAADYQEIDRLMVLIERRKFNSPDVPDLVSELKEAADSHQARCRCELEPALRAALGSEEMATLGERMTNADKMVIAHPHPHFLSLGPVSAKLTAFLARFDRWRDKTVTNLPPPPPGS